MDTNKQSHQIHNKVQKQGQKCTPEWQRYWHAEVNQGQQEQVRDSEVKSELDCRLVIYYIAHPVRKRSRACCTVLHNAVDINRQFIIICT